MISVTGLRWQGIPPALEGGGFVAGGGGGGVGVRLIGGKSITGGDVVSLKVLKNGGEAEVLVVRD